MAIIPLNSFLKIKGRCIGLCSSSIDAMANIIDNSIENEASKIDIIYCENSNLSNGIRTLRGGEIIIADNGSGMNETILSKYFSFPNESLDFCRRLEIYTKERIDKKNIWRKIVLDLDEEINIEEKYLDAMGQFQIPVLSEVTKEKPELPGLSSLNNLNEYNTIIMWQKLDNIEFAKASTIIKKSNEFLGRIYRYFLLNDLSIKFYDYLKPNEIVREIKEIVIYDPLLVTQKKNYFTDLIWKYSQEQETQGVHKILGNEHPNLFTSKYHYKKFTDGCVPYKSQRPLFQKLEVRKFKTKINGVAYKWKIKASFANNSITNPGIREGSRTMLGRALGKKMKIGNISFIRENREVDCGDYGFYNVFDPKEQYWSIEVHFNRDLDVLIGLTKYNRKIPFRNFYNYDLEKNETKPRDILFKHMSKEIQDVQRTLNQYIYLYQKDFKKLEKEMIEKGFISD